MSSPPGKSRSWLTVLIVIAAVAVWAYDQRRALDPPAKPITHRTAEKSDSPPASIPSAGSSSKKAGGYEVYQNCKLAEARNNDGDSFMTILPDGKKSELRLYYVDTPESAFKSYAGGENNHQRIAEQAAEMGGITPQQAVQVGQDAKHFTLDLLASNPFDVYTRWDSPFNDQRYHAFIQVKQGGKPRWLHELLVEKGLVRIHTKGADLPDGTTYAKHKARLKELESSAKKAAVGAWGK